MYGGLPVENARVQVNLDRQGNVLSVFSSYVPPAQAQENVAVARDKAVDLAVEEFLRTTPRTPPPKHRPRESGGERAASGELVLKEEPQVEDVYFARQEQLRRAYKVRVYARFPFGLKELTVDAASGEILRVRNRVQEAENASGQVFLPSPVTSLNDDSLTDDGDADSAVINNNPNPYFTVGVLDLDVPSGGPYSLQGPFVRLEDIEAPSNTPPSEAAASFVYQRNSDDFEDVMVYFHIDRLQRYIQMLGFIDVNNRQIRVDAHAVSGADNSFHVGDPVGSGYLIFGEGEVDDAEDAEIVSHEYGHAIQDNQTNGKYSGNAMGEGFGDYIGVSVYLAETVAAGHVPACVGDWDATSYDASVPHCLRRLDTGKTTDDVVGETHADGEIWSQALWNMLNDLGKTTADRLVLQSHFNAPDSPTFHDGADAMMTADLQLFFGSHLDQLCQIFKDRKIYTDADCLQVPPSSGGQDTLVLLVNFSDGGVANDPIGFPQVQTIVDGLNNYLAEVTYAQVSLTPTIKGWYDLPQTRAHYYDQTSANLLIELVDDTLAAIQASEPGFDVSAFDRMLILTNDDGSGGETRGLQEWATTGPWPYTLPGGFGSKLLSVSVHRFDHGEARLTHALGHHFRLIDLYPHPGVTFPRPYADGWDNMAQDAGGSFTNIHFLGWSKLRPGWLTGDDVEFVARPPADPDPNSHFDEIFPLHRQEVDGAGREVIQIGTTAGVTDREQERVSYYVEARDKSGPYDGGIPSSGVLIYYLNEDISQGFGPLRLVDATPDDDDLTDAAFQIGGSVNNIDGTGLNVEVLAPTGTEDYRIHVDYDPPETDVDAWIHVRDTSWRSQDIWVDSPACNMGTCGFDAVEGRTETDRGDKPKPEQANRLYARVYNHGPGTAHNVRVDFWISDPYYGIDGGGTDPDTGGNVAFNKHFFTVIADMPQTDDGVPVWVEWTPLPVPPGQNAPHACVKVRIAEVFNDTNDANQVSQENIHEYDTTSGSPYGPVTQPFRVANPYDHPILTYLRADDLPVGWTADIVPSKVYLPVGGSADAQITIQPPEDYPVCSTELVKVSAWYPSGDTLVELGGTTAQVNLKKRERVTLETGNGPCRNQTFAALKSSATDRCSVLTSQGCTDPPRPFEHITLEYTGPDGNPIYHDVVTDKDGCFEDFLVNPQGGIWEVEATYPGNECFSIDVTQGRPVIVPPQGLFPGGLGSRIWLSFHLGMGFPTGSFNNAFDPGPSLTLDLEYPFSDRLALRALLGYHYFHGIERDLSYTNASLNVRGYFPAAGWRAFVDAGFGAYRPDTGGTDPGLNLGVGWAFGIDPRLDLEIAAEQHLVDPGGDDRQFLDLILGLKVRF